MLEFRTCTVAAFWRSVANIVLFLFLASLLLIAAPSEVLAAQTNDAEDVPIAQFGVLQYMIRPWDEETWIAAITAELSQNEQLPATIEIAVPEGVFVYFFGEVGGTQFPNPTPVRTENGLDIYTGILTTGNIVHLEYTLEGNPVGPEPSMNISYTPLRNVGELHLIAAFPANSAVTDPQFEYMDSGPDGEPAFAYIVESAIGGQEYSISIPYRANVDLSVSNPFIVGGLVVIMVILAAGVFWVFGRKKYDDDDDYDWDDKYDDDDEYDDE